ncbi:unnamed protein product [Calicophoron daubneyi]|uniref:Uncharacterized protein n=1 Tax=Calicophoron daubneyi TaxID=300641 RepID=A0AAV2TI62_CALDB
MIIYVMNVFVEVNEHQFRAEFAKPGTTGLNCVTGCRPKRICCPAVFYVTNKFGDLKITSYKMLHNHARGARHRDTSLNDFEENEMKPLLEYEYTTGELQQFALVHFNKFLSTHDVMNLKEKTAAERRRECNAKQGANLIKEDTLTLDSPVRSKNDHGYIAADSDDEATSVSLEKRIRGLLSSTDRNTQLHIISLVEARRSMSKDQYGELIRGLTNYTEAFMKAVVPNSCKYVPG